LAQTIQVVESKQLRVRRVYADATRLDDTLDLPTRLIVQLAAVLAAGELAEFIVWPAPRW
jgi:hypothetical protein